MQHPALQPLLFCLLASWTARLLRKGVLEPWFLVLSLLGLAGLAVSLPDLPLALPAVAAVLLAFAEPRLEELVNLPSALVLPVATATSWWGVVHYEHHRQLPIFWTVEAALKTLLSAALLRSLCTEWSLADGRGRLGLGLGSLLALAGLVLSWAPYHGLPAAELALLGAFLLLGHGATRNRTL